MKHMCTAVLVSASVAVLLQLVPAEAFVINSSCQHNNSTNSYFFGQKSYYDRVLYHDHLNYKSKWMRVVSVDVTYPPKGSPSLGTISYIEALDQRGDGTGGCVYIRNGGVGSNSVTLHVKSQRNHGMEFLINVYGR